MHATVAATRLGGCIQPLTVGIVPTFPPTSCGIAMFSAALVVGLTAECASVDLVRTDASPDHEDLLVDVLVAAVLNAAEVVIVQHEFGLSVGRDGAGVVELAAGIEVPIVVVAHTALPVRSSNQRSVLENGCAPLRRRSTPCAPTLHRITRTCSSKPGTILPPPQAAVRFGGPVLCTLPSGKWMVSSRFGPSEMSHPASWILL